MSQLATRTAAPLIESTTRALGATLPDNVAAAIAAARGRAHDHARHFEPAAVDLTAAIAAAVDEERDPLDCDRVRRAFMAHQLIEAKVPERLATLAQERAAAVIVDSVDQILDAWRPAVKKADKALSDFRKHAPGGDPTSEDYPRGLRPAALTPWGMAKESAHVLEQVAQGFNALASLGAVRPTEWRPLILADLSAAQLDTLGRRARATAVLSLDVHLDLPTADAYHQRLERIDRERGEQQRWESAAPQRARQERRDRVPHWVLDDHFAGTNS